MGDGERKADMGLKYESVNDHTNVFRAFCPAIGIRITLYKETAGRERIWLDVKMKVEHISPCGC